MRIRIRVDVDGTEGEGGERIEGIAFAEMSAGVHKCIGL